MLNRFGLHILLIFVGAACCAAQSDWPQYQYNAQHIGHNPDCEIMPPLQLQWSRKLSELPLMQATIVGDKVYVTNWLIWKDPTLWCLDIKDGSEVWRREYGEVASKVMQASAGYGRLFVQVDNHLGSWVEALTLDSGFVMWQSEYRQQGQYALAPTIYDGRVIIANNTYGGMHCFDVFTGQLLWKVRKVLESEWTPAVFEGTAYAFLRGYLGANDIATGESKWVKRLEPFTSGNPRNSPVMDTIHNIIYVTSYSALFAVDLNTREVIWEKHDISGFRRTPALYDGKIFTIKSARFEAYDALTGEFLGRYPTDWEFPSFGWEEGWAPVVANGYVFVSSKTMIHAIDPVTIEEVWNYPVCGHLSLCADHLIVATPTGEVHAFSKLPTGADNETHAGLPGTFTLYQNYPNPFNSSTVISYDLPTRSHVEISVYNTLGRKVATLLSDIQSASSHSVEWNGTNEGGRPVSSGTYFYRLKTDDLVQTKKMVLLK